MNEYEQRQEEKRERLLERAKKARKESGQAFSHSHSLLDPIPMGQPILVGHHSEARHRRTLERSDSAMRKSVEMDKKAEYLEHRAASVGTAGVSSDDPEAITKLKTKMGKLEEMQELMKAVNKAYRQGGWDKVAADVPTFSELMRNAAIQAMAQDWQPESKRRPFVSWQLSNSNAEINRLKRRISELDAQQQQEDFEDTYDEFKVTIEENRFRFFFDGKPSEEVRTLLKRSGFKWSPRAGAWQRQATSNGVAIGQRLIEPLRALMA